MCATLMLRVSLPYAEVYLWNYDHVIVENRTVRPTCNKYSK